MLARELIRHRDAPPMLLVLTARPAEDAETAARIDAITTNDLRNISLEALALAQAVELASQLRNAYAPKLALDLELIARETAGHPLYISELVRYAATRSRGDGSSATPRLDEAILARIGELPTEAEVLPDDPRRELLGHVGVTRSKMLPSGAVEINGQMVDAITQGKPIEPGQYVVVTEVRANRVVVRPAKENERPGQVRRPEDLLSRPIER